MEASRSIVIDYTKSRHCTAANNLDVVTKTDIESTVIKTRLSQGQAGRKSNISRLSSKCICVCGYKRYVVV